MGEILSDIFGLIQKIVMVPSIIDFHGMIMIIITNDIFCFWQEQMSWESAAILDECLKCLFIFHTLSQGSDSVNYALNVLLEAIFMVFNASDVFPSHVENNTFFIFTKDYACLFFI